MKVGGDSVEPASHYVAEEELEFLIPLPLPRKC